MAHEQIRGQFSNLRSDSQTAMKGRKSALRNFKNKSVNPTKRGGKGKRIRKSPY